MPSLGPYQYTLIGINDIPSGAENTEVVFSVPETDQIYVKAGDFIGWSYPGTPTALQYTLTAAPTETVDTQIHFLMYGLLDNLHDVLQLNVTYNVDSEYDYREYSIMATVQTASGEH